MDTFNKLVDLFRQFPGIGPRQAKRFVYFLLSGDKPFLEGLVDMIAALKREITQCQECFRFFGSSIGIAKSTHEQVATLCHICADKNRGDEELMVVAKDVDLEAMEKSNTYRGKYFVLGGLISPMERRNPNNPRLRELQIRVGKGAKAGVLKEVILALSANPDGEHTSDGLKRMLSEFPIKISILGRGLSTGSELEYADKETLKSALKNRSAT